MAQIKQTKTRIEYINLKTTTSTAAKIINFCIFSMCYVLVHILCTRSKLDVSIFEPSLGNIEKKTERKLISFSLKFNKCVNVFEAVIEFFALMKFTFLSNMALAAFFTTQ